MIRESKGFLGVLTKVASKVRAEQEDVVLSFNVRHTNTMGDQQTFLDTFESKCQIPNISSLFRAPVQWKTISIDVASAIGFEMDFDEITFDCMLTGIKVRRADKKDLTQFIYDLSFEKEMDKDSDMFLSYYLNKKEENEDGRKILVEYPVHLRLSDDELQE